MKSINIRGVQQRGENSFFFTVSLGRGSDGKYKRATKTYKVEEKFSPRRLEEHIQHEYLKFKSKVESGIYIKPEKMTFSTFVNRWKEQFVFRELAETTITNRISILKNHITPVLGHKSMDQINTPEINDLLNNLTRKDGTDGPVSDYTRDDVYKTLKSIFKHAKKEQIIKHDPMSGVYKPRIKKVVGNELNVYDEEEYNELLDKAQNEPFHWRMFITLTLTAGLRRGEALGLEWEDVDLKNSTLDIRQAIVRGRKGAVIKLPKGDKTRLISLPSSVNEELKQYRLFWMKEKLRLGDRWEEDKREWLFCNTDGSHLYPTTPTTWWRRFTERVNVRRIRLHDLRHTSATLQIAQGVHAKIISERLGHSRIDITMDTYGHALRSADEKAAAVFDNIRNKNKKSN